MQGPRLDDPILEPTGALGDLMFRYERPISNYLRVLLADDEAALDCAQETFLAAYEHLCADRAVNARWLYRVAYSRAIDAMRLRKHVRTDNDLLDQVPALEINSSQETREVLAALDLLSADDRNLLYLFLVDKVSTTEIAQILGVRPGAVRARLTRARNRLRQAFEEVSHETS